LLQNIGVTGTDILKLFSAEWILIFILLKQTSTIDIIKGIIIALINEMYQILNMKPYGYEIINMIT